MTDYREKARAWLADNNAYAGHVGSLTAAMKEVAEEAVEKIGLALDPHYSKGGDAEWLAKRVIENYKELEARLAAFTSATPDSPEVKEALKWDHPDVYDNHGNIGWTPVKGTREEAIRVLARALRAAQVRIKESGDAGYASGVEVTEARAIVRIKVLEERLENWKAECEKAVSLAEKLQAGIEAMARNCEDWKTAIAATQAKLAEVRADHKLQVEALSETLAGERAKLADLSEENKLVSEQRDRMAEKLEVAQAKLDGMTVTMREGPSARIKDLEGELAECRKELENVRAWPQGDYVLKRDEYKVRAEKAEAFKTWTHDYLDKRGVPATIEDEHLTAGCRIGGRMDWVFAKLAAMTKERDILRQTSAILCDECGWAMKFPDDGCRNCQVATLTAALEAIQTLTHSQPRGELYGFIWKLATKALPPLPADAKGEKS